MVEKTAKREELTFARFRQIRGTYMLSNLLQELALARDHGQKSIVLDEARLNENPVARLSRMCVDSPEAVRTELKADVSGVSCHRIRHSFWSNLTRRIDGDGLEAICADPKVRPFPPFLRRHQRNHSLSRRHQNRGKNQAPRIYVPEAEVQMRKYYERVALERPKMGLIVDTLPKDWDAAWVRSKNESPGILALAMREIKRPGQDSDFTGIPFVVPGARYVPFFAVVSRVRC